MNLTEPDLARHPHFARAVLHEAIVGPADVLYLPAWWWHQFEQPFEDSALLNLWSRDWEGAPDASLRDWRLREHALSDQLEGEVTRVLGNRAGVAMEALALAARRQAPAETMEMISARELASANATMHAAAHAWCSAVARMPGSHPRASHSAQELVAWYLQMSHTDVIRSTRWRGWAPGAEWDASRLATLPRALRDRCRPAPTSSPFVSDCA